MITTDVRVGRLVAMRFRLPFSDAELDAFEASTRPAPGAPMPDQKAVVCVDLTGCRVVPSGPAERIISIMQATTTGLEKQAFLMANDSATFQMQIDRMIRSTGHPEMRVFHQAVDVAAYLQPSLAVAEQLHLQKFLAGVGAR